MLLLLQGLGDVTDARLLGRLLGSRDTPKESRLVLHSPVVLVDGAIEACEALFRLLRTVTVLGM